MTTERKQARGQGMQMQVARVASLVATATIGGTAGTAVASTAEHAPAPAKRRLFLDVHDLGPGKVDAAAVAEAHRKDLATQGRYGVHFRAYWLDEKQGRIYCLVEA